MRAPDAPDFAEVEQEQPKKGFFGKLFGGKKDEDTVIEDNAPTTDDNILSDEELDNIRQALGVSQNQQKSISKDFEEKVSQPKVKAQKPQTKPKVKAKPKAVSKPVKKVAKPKPVKKAEPKKVSKPKPKKDIFEEEL